MRLTKNTIAQILSQNDGFETTTHQKQRNFSCDYHYLIEGGKLFIHAVGKTSWADSKYNDTYEAFPEQARRFLRKFLYQ